jgi:hypothetical protein
MIWLWAVTAFSSATAAVTGLGWAVTSYKLSNARWALVQQEQANKHSNSFHRCPEHANTSLFNGADAEERARSLGEIGERNWRLHRNRTD